VASYYLDTNVLIAIVEAAGPLTKEQSGFIARIDAGEHIAIASELALSECLVKPIADANEAAIRAYLALFDGGHTLAVMAVSRDILVEAARLRAVSRMKLADAIHFATALAASCSVFMTDDSGIRPTSDLIMQSWRTMDQ